MRVHESTVVLTHEPPAYNPQSTGLYTVRQPPYIAQCDAHDVRRHAAFVHIASVLNSIMGTTYGMVCTVMRVAHDGRAIHLVTADGPMEDVVRKPIVAAAARSNQIVITDGYGNYMELLKDGSLKPL